MPASSCHNIHVMNALVRKFTNRLKRYFFALPKPLARKEDRYDLAMRQALARKPFLNTGGSYLLREESHERSRS